MTVSSWTINPDADYHFFKDDKILLRLAKWQTEPFTDKILRQLQEEPKVILESGRILHTQSDHSVPDLSDVANFVECPLNEEDIYINVSVSRDNNEDAFASDVAIKRDEAVQDIEETLLKMFENECQNPRKVIVKKERKTKSKRKEHLKELLIKLFGSTLDDLNSPEEVDSKQERKNSAYTPGKIQMDRRESLPVSIRFDDDILKPLKVNQKRKSEGDVEIVPVKKLQIEELKPKTEVLTVEYTKIVDLVIPPVYTETLKIVDLPNLAKATVMVTPCVQEACRNVSNKVPAIIDLTGEDSSNFSTSSVQYNPIRFELKIEPRVESEQANIPAALSMPLLSPVSPAVPTQIEAVLPQGTSHSMEQFQRQQFQNGLTIEPVQVQRPQEEVQSNLTIEPVNQTGVIMQPIQTQRPPPEHQSPVPQGVQGKGKQKNRRQSREESPAQQKKKQKGPAQKKAVTHYQSQMSGGSVQQQQAMVQQQQPMVQQQQQVRRLSQPVREEIAQMDALIKRLGPDPKNYLPQSHMFQMHSNLLPGQTSNLRNYRMAQKQSPPNVSLAPQQQPGAGHQQRSNYQSQNNQQLSPPAMSRLYPLQAPRLGYQVLSNATFAEKIFPYMCKALKWRTSPSKYLNQMTTFLDVNDWKEEKARFVEYAQKRIKACSERMVNDLAEFVVEGYQLVDLLSALAKMFEDKQYSVNLFHVCNFLYSFMLQPIEELCSTPFLKRFYSTVKAAVERMEERSNATQVPITTTQLQQLKLQIQQFWNIQIWLNACARKEAAQKTNEHNSAPTTRNIQAPNTTHPSSQDSNVQTRNNVTNPRPESLLLPQRTPVQAFDGQTRSNVTNPRPESLVLPQRTPVQTFDGQTRSNVTNSKPESLALPQRTPVQAFDGQTRSNVTNPRPESLASLQRTPVQAFDGQTRSNVTNPRPESLLLPQQTPVQTRGNVTNPRPESSSLPQQSPVQAFESSVRPPERSPRLDSLFASVMSSSLTTQQVPETTRPTENVTCNKPKESEKNTAEDAVSTTVKDETKPIDEVVDLTWIDDGDENEIRQEIMESKAFAIKFENLDEAEPSPREAISPTDSGLGSPGATPDDDGFKCLCGNRAIYVCACNSSMYCSSDCQNKDWMYHQKLCHKMKS